MVCQKVKIKKSCGTASASCGKIMRRGDQIQIKDFFSERNNDYKCKEPFECAGGRH